MPPRSPSSRVAAGLVLLAGCYTYTPTQQARLQPGDRVRIRVTAAEAERVQPLLGRTDTRVLAGQVIATGADTVIVQVPVTMQTAGAGSYQPLQQRVSFPRDALLDVEHRALNRRRTTIAVGAATIILGAVVLRTTVLGPGKIGPPGGGTPPELWQR